MPSKFMIALKPLGVMGIHLGLWFHQYLLIVCHLEVQNALVLVLGGLVADLMAQNTVSHIGTEIA